MSDVDVQMNYVKVHPDRHCGLLVTAVGNCVKWAWLSPKTAAALGHTVNRATGTERPWAAHTGLLPVVRWAERPPGRMRLPSAQPCPLPLQTAESGRVVCSIFACSSNRLHSKQICVYFKGLEIGKNKSLPNLSEVTVFTYGLK